MGRTKQPTNSDGTEPISSNGIDGTEPISSNGNDGSEQSTTNEPAISFTIDNGESTVSSGKRGRGRPRKNPEGQGSQTVIKTKGAKVTAQDKKDAKELTDFIISSFEMMSALILAQQNTSFNEMEKFLLEPALRRQLERMNFSAIEKANKFLDPLFIFGALALWANRVVIQSNKDNKSNASNATKSNEISNTSNQQTPSNGSDNVEYPNLGKIFS